MKENKIVIVGGGASGMMCALYLAEGGQKNITVLERNDRMGKKLSATGNGQGNVTNRNFGGEHYFSDDKQKTEAVLNAFPPEKLIEYLEKLGGLFEEDERGRVYPTGRQASAVTDLLRFALQKAGVQTLTGVKIEKITRKNGGYELSDGNGQRYQADMLVMATGGKAAKNFGTDGLGYELLRSLGHSVTALYPALVQLKTDTTDLKGLRGIRSECVVKAFIGGKGATHARGDVIFTDYGVSGNAIFTLSSYLTDRTGGELSIDFLPDVPEQRLTQILQQKQALRPENELLGCVVNNQLGRSIVRRVEREYGKVTAANVAHTVKDFRLKVVGTLGFDQAQVTRGGVPMSEVDGNLRSKKSPELFLCGEVLNVDGECGGYNLQWAFASAVRVAEEILREAKA
jgi:hypothetical protein